MELGVLEFDYFVGIVLGRFLGTRYRARRLDGFVAAEPDRDDGVARAMRRYVARVVDGRHSGIGAAPCEVRLFRRVFGHNRDGQLHRLSDLYGFRLGDRDTRDRNVRPVVF